MAIKSFLVGLTLLVKALCHYFLKYQATIIQAVLDSSLTTDQKATVINWLEAGQAACALLREITGY